MSEKICFVAMGFGKKMDYQNSKEVDLDKIYEKVIKPLFERDLTEYKLIRADEIAGSALIDISMYALLINADLVIADITTLNSNAIYELGIRHAVKPFSTIIMAQKSCKIPFDLNHSRFLTYDDIGEQLDEQEAMKIQEQLKSFVIESEKKLVDSPLYSFLPTITPPTISDEEYKKLIQEAENKTDTISSFIEQATESMNLNDFKEATKMWYKLKDLLPNNEYIVQQLALSTYKYKCPNETKALELALDIIKELNPENSLDLETLGITGAIYKRLFRLNHNFDYLNDAIAYYKKGFIIKKDYYNGENYANCLLLKSQDENSEQLQKNYLKYESRNVYKEVIDIILKSLEEEEENFWMYATLAVCYFALEDEESHKKYQDIFYGQCSAKWQKETYLDTINELRPSIQN